MTTLQIASVHTLDTNCCNKYEGIAFDGCFFYLTLPACQQVHKFDSCFCLIEPLETGRGYTSLCYDPCFDCFWALCAEDGNRIYKLDHCLREIDYIQVSCCDGIPLVLTGVACACEERKLLLSCSAGIAEITKSKCPSPRMLKKTAAWSQFTSIEGFPSGYLYSLSRTGGSSICVCSCCNEPVLECCMPDEYQVEDMTAFPCLCAGDCSVGVYLLATKRGCYSYLIKCALLQGSEYDCRPIPGGFPPPCPPPCNPDGCCKPANCNNIIESIALVETALSHILNAEGEKIQKILSCAQDSDEIMQVNDSVNQTIVNITHLEQVLYAKLQFAKECHKPPHDPCDPCDPCVCCP